jgi:hypothetical protein
MDSSKEIFHATSSQATFLRIAELFNMVLSRLLKYSKIHVIIKRYFEDQD